MKPLSMLAIAVALVATGCGSDNNTPTTPSPATKVVFRASLTGANEVPPVTDAEGQGTGTMNITFNLTRDTAGNITAATADFSGTFSGFPAGTILTAAHIHPGAAGTNGNPLVNTNIASGEVTFPNGSGSLVRSGIAVQPTDANAIINNPSAYYFNIHTSTHPGGVSRGQLSQTSSS